MFKSLLLGCAGGVVWLSIDGCNGRAGIPLDVLGVVVIVGNSCSMPVALDELLLLIRRWLTVVVDVDDERPPKPLMYPLPIDVDGGVAKVPVTIVDVFTADLFTLRSVGPVVSIHKRLKLYIYNE